jgi:hypothetical protein
MSLPVYVVILYCHGNITYKIQISEQDTSNLTLSGDRAYQKKNLGAKFQEYILKNLSSLIIFVEKSMELVVFRAFLP